MKNKSVGVLVAAIICITFLVGASDWEIIDRIVAKVNDDIITQGDLEDNVKLFLLKMGRPYTNEGELQEIYTKVLDKMIDDMLLLQEAKRKGFHISEKELDVLVESNISRFRDKYPTQKELDEAIESSGFSPATFEKDYRHLLEKEWYIRTLLRALTRNVEISDEDIKEFEEERPAMAHGLDSVTVRHILLKCPRGADSSEAALVEASAEKLLIRLKAGENFYDLAMKYSEHESSREKGGYIGDVKHGELFPEFEAVFDVPTGGYSDVIRTDLGFHILQVLDRSSVEEYLREQRSQERIGEWLDELREEADIARKRF